MTDNTQPEALAALIERFRGLHIDHEPNGWPAVRTREITALLDRIADLEAQLEAIGAGGVSPLIGQPQAMPDLTALTERGAKAWAGVDAQGLREGFTAADMATAAAQGFRDGVASLSASAPAPSAHIKEPYTLAEIKAKIASNDYGAELLLQHAMALLDSASLAASAGSEPVAPAAVAGCTRSHPHENMDSACRAKAAIAEMRNKAARGAEATAHDLERFVSMLAAALVEAQQPATHVQNSTEIEHVAGDVSQNWAESNMSTQPATQQEAQEPVAWYVTGCDLLLDEDEAKAEARHIGGTARAMPLYTAPQADSQPALPEITAELRRLHTENERLASRLKAYEDLGGAADDVQLLRMGYAAARLEIESLQARIKTMRAPTDSVTAPAGGADWQDISTAPKDGTRFVAVGQNYGLDSEKQHTCIAQWLAGCWVEVSDWNGASKLKYLTHWMPLPPLPGSAARAPADSVLEDAERLLALEAEANLIFNNPPSETSQDVRDVIEWFSGSIRVVLDAARKQGGA